MNRLLALFGPLPFLALAIVAMGLSIGMGVCVYDALSPLLAPLTSWLRYPLTGIVFALCYFAYGLSLLVIAPALNFLFGGRLSPLTCTRTLRIAPSLSSNVKPRVVPLT